MSRIAILTVAVLLLAGCHDSKNSNVTETKLYAPAPPSGHGGFKGAAGLAYAKAFVVCFLKTKRTLVGGSPDSLSFVQLPAEPNAHLIRVGTAGCRAGAAKAGLTYTG